MAIYSDTKIIQNKRLTINFELGIPNISIAIKDLYHTVVKLQEYINDCMVFIGTKCKIPYRNDQCTKGFVLIYDQNGNSFRSVILNQHIPHLYSSVHAAHSFIHNNNELLCVSGRNARINLLSGIEIHNPGLDVYVYDTNNGTLIAQITIKDRACYLDGYLNVSIAFLEKYLFLITINREKNITTHTWINSDSWSIEEHSRCSSANSIIPNTKLIRIHDSLSAMVVTNCKGCSDVYYF